MRKLRPDDPDGVLYDSVMGAAWEGCIHWAAGVPEIRDQFTKDTGLAFPTAPKTALDAMIDAATGYQEHALFMFTQWVTVTLFGELEDAPEAFQAACRERPLPVRTNS